MNKEKFLVRFGVIGTVLVALCCFTPALVLLLSAVGLSALTGYLDFVLLPALGIFIGITVYAFYRKTKRDAENCCESQPNIETATNEVTNTGDSHE